MYLGIFYLYAQNSRKLLFCQISAFHAFIFPWLLLFPFTAQTPRRGICAKKEFKNAGKAQYPKESEYAFIYHPNVVPFNAIV